MQKMKDTSELLEIEPPGGGHHLRLVHTGKKNSLRID